MTRSLLIGVSIIAAGVTLAQAQNRLDREEIPPQQYGWQQAPRQIDLENINRPLTELEKLSLSESGLRFGQDAYDPRSDNPLEPVAVTLRALDKITARYTDLVIDMNAEAKFGTLAIIPRTCDKRPPEEVPEITAFLEIYATDDFVRLPTIGAEEDDAAGVQPEPMPAVVGPGDTDATAIDTAMSVADTGPETQAGGATLEDDDGDSTLFEGWMFASSPALNALEHPVYDVWVVDCKMVDPSI